MADWTIKNVAFRGVAACVPKKILKTEDIDLFTKDEAAKFNEQTGIKERRIADVSICTSDLCYEASLKLISDLQWNKNDIDALVFVSVTPDYRTPATSCILQDRLGLSKDCFTLDISLGCCGYLHGLTVLSSLISSSGGSVKKGLLLVGDTIYRTSSPYDKSRLPLFGDAGTASALEYDEKAEDIKSSSYSDGSYHLLLHTPDSGFRHPVTPESFVYKDYGNGIRRANIHGVMDGLDVFSLAIREGAIAVKKFLQKHNLDKDKDIDYYLFHQANLQIMRILSKKIKLAEAQVPFALQRFGNTSSACIPLVMVTQIREALMQGKLNLILFAIGVGFTWGCMQLITDKIVCSELIEI